MIEKEEEEKEGQQQLLQFLCIDPIYSWASKHSIKLQSFTLSIKDVNPFSLTFSTRQKLFQK